MIIRKYTDKDGANMEVSVSENDLLLIQVEYAGQWTAIELDYEDVLDLEESIERFKRQIGATVKKDGHI